MSYKTFEDMKNGIPEGATHYSNETALDHFAWVRYEGDSVLCIMPDSELYDVWHCRVLDDVRVIPTKELTQEWNGEGLPPVEWKNGDECIYKSNGAVVIGWHPIHPALIIDSSEFGIISCSVDQIRKPETTQQREERERLEAAIELHDTFNAKYCKGNVDVLGGLGWGSCPDHVKECYFAIVDKTGYRKAK